MAAALRKGVGALPLAGRRRCGWPEVLRLAGGAAAPASLVREIQAALRTRRS